MQRPTRTRTRTPLRSAPKALPPDELARVQGGILERDDQVLCARSYADWPTTLS